MRSVYENDIYNVFLEKIELKYICVGKFIQYDENFGTYTHELVMAWFLILQYILCPLALLVQVVGLILLCRRKQVLRNRNQIYILIGLCHSESALAIFNILYMFELLPSR